MIKKISLKDKPRQLWEYRVYSKGSLLENGIALNDTAAFIYQNCNGKNTILDILSELCRRYGVREEKAKKDLLPLIKDLIREGAIEI